MTLGASDLPFTVRDLVTKGLTVDAPVFNVKSSDNGPAATGDGVTDDTAAIQAKINAASAGSYGGIVVLPAAPYRVTTPLTIGADNVMLVGAGPGSPKGTTPGSSANPAFGGTIIRAGGTFVGSAVIKVAQTSVTRALSGVQLRGFSINGFSTPASTQGIYWQVFNGGMERLNVSGVTGDGIVLQGNGATAYPNGAWDSFLSRIKVDQVGGNGLTFNSYATDHQISDVIVEYAGGHGISIDSTSTANRFNHAYVYNCTGKAVNAANMHQLKFTAGRFQDCNGGIYLSASTGTGGFLIDGCTFRNMSFAADNTTDAINLTSSNTIRGGLITACDFHTDAGNANGGTNPNHFRARYGINIASGNLNGLVVGPCSQGYNATEAASCFGTNFVNDSGASTILIGPSARTAVSAEVKFGNSVRVLTDSASPEGAVTAAVGSIYLRTGGGAGTTLYIKESGSGSVGWVAK
jgi:hypothetical protein